jgi:hypothetical protein
MWIWVKAWANAIQLKHFVVRSVGEGVRAQNAEKVDESGINVFKGDTRVVHAH